MRRFIRTVTSRRHVNFFVIQDGAARTFEVLRWAAEQEKPEQAACSDYLPECDGFSRYEAAQSKDEARRKAIIEAQRLAREEDERFQAEAAKARHDRSDEEAERIAQRLSPQQQERARRF